MKVKRPPLTELQKASLLTGQLLRKCSCTSELIKLLKSEGYLAEAANVEQALALGRKVATERGKRAISAAKANIVKGKNNV